VEESEPAPARDAEMADQGSAARLETGIPGFDSITNGGLPKGRATLVVGTSGTGKTIFGLQYLATGARRYGHKGVLVTFEEVPEDLVKNAESFGWGLSDLVANDSFRVVDASPEPSDPAEFDFDELLIRIRDAVARVGADRVVLDSVGALFPQLRDPFTIRRGLRQLIEGLRPLRVTTVVTTERTEDYGPVARFGVEDFVVDGIVVLRHPLERRVRSRTVEILKLRGASHMSGEFPFTIGAQRGIEVIPRPVFELRKRAPAERISTGNAELDEICGGGYFKDSVVLVSGATGTGKTLIGCEFVGAAVKSGARALLFSFEESRSQLIRNAGSWGIDLEAAEQSGLVKLVFRRPERMLLEDLLLDLRRIVEEFKPTRVVIAGLTALERSSLPDAFREFSVAVTSFVKEKDIAVIFTETATLDMQFGGAAESHVSTMTDAIILLRYVETGGAAHRGLMLLKMRGSRHERGVHEYEIADDGLRVLGPMPDVVGFIPAAPTARPTAPSADADPVSPAARD
jgi:circadian clock protein KaiC